MQQIPDYSDERTRAFCVHCGGATATRDHVPSRVLLDEPYPENLPVVPCCGKCNNALSLDEEYFACLIDCDLTGHTTPVESHRPKIRRILERAPELTQRIARACTFADGRTVFAPESARVRNVVLKLARGHAVHELAVLELEEPSHLAMRPMRELTHTEEDAFERIDAAALWPEVGSRAMLRTLTGAGGWIEVQRGRYRFAAFIGEAGTTVKIALSEYLAVEVAWED